MQFPQTLKLRLAAVWNAVYFAMAVSKAPRLGFNAFQQRRDEVGEATRAIGSKIVFPREVVARWPYAEIADEGAVHPIQMSV